MAGFMGDDLNISLGAVEVGEDEGDFVIRNAGAIAAAGLAFGGQDI